MLVFYFIFFLIQIVLIGVLAQQWRGRTGVIWSAIAFGLDAIAAFFLDSAISSNPKFIVDPGAYNTTGHDIAFVLMTASFSTVICLISIATLPNSKRATPVKTCPQCAETVKAAAIKCRFCEYGFDVEPVV
ncbi:MAG TPA: zinc ribbon domain-containing protein [Parvibaculum sp.]|jgi:hypothetical protein